MDSSRSEGGAPSYTTAGTSEGVRDVIKAAVGIAVTAGAVAAGILLSRRSGQLGAPWVLPAPESREMDRCFRSASREARPRNFDVKNTAIRALLDANPRLRDLVDRDCGSDCR